MASVQVDLEVKPRLALAYAVMWLAPIVGAERASRWAYRVGMWRSRWRVGGGPWQRFRA